MSEVLDDMLGGKVSSNEVVNWITNSGTLLNYSCSKDSFICYFLTWLRSHVTHALPSEPALNNNNNNNSYNVNKSRVTPNRKRPDKRRSTGNYHSPGSSTHKGSRTPKSGNKTPQTPFKDSLSSMRDYPPLSSSTPVEEGVSRITKPEQVLKVKRRVDFSRSFPSGLSESRGSQLNAPSSPPTVRRVALTPLKPEQQCPRMAELTKQVRETSPFNQVPVSSPSVQISIFKTDTQDSQQSSDFKANITPTKSRGDDPSDSAVFNGKNAEFGAGLSVVNVSSDTEIINGSLESSTIDKKRELSLLSTVIANDNPSQDTSNKSVVAKSGNCVSRKKKIKRVPLMTISNHAKPNWTEKSDLSSTSDKLNVKSLDSRFCDRFGGNSNGVDSKPSGFFNRTIDNDTHESFKAMSLNGSSSVTNGFGSKEFSGHFPESKHQEPIKVISIQSSGSNLDLRPRNKSTEIKERIPTDNTCNKLNSSTSNNIIPTRRVSLQPVKGYCSFGERSSLSGSNSASFPAPTAANNPFSSTGSQALPVRRISLAPSKPSSTDQKVGTIDEISLAKAAFQVTESSFCSGGYSESELSLDKSEDGLSEDKKKERALVYNLAEVYTVLLNEVFVSNLASEIQLLLSMIKSPASKAVSLISSHRIYFISTVLHGLDIWIRHLSPTLLVELEKHVDITVTKVNPPLPLFASDISIASVPFQMDEDTRPQFPNDRVFHVFKRIRDTFHSLLRDWEDGHNNAHSWNTEQVLGERMKSLLNQKLQLAIFTHFSKLFINLLLKKYKADLCELKCNSAEKLKKLQTRLSESEKVGSKICGPATFPKSQDFFKTFIVVSQNYSLNKHLTDHLIGKIALLDKQTKSWFSDSIELDQSDLQEEFSWNLLSLQLLGKFLGLVWYMPYYTTQKIPPTVLTTLRETRTEPFPLDLNWYLTVSISEGALTLTIPWVCEVLVMMDAVCVTLNKTKLLLSAVNNIYIQLYRLPIRQENKVMLLFKLGRVMELLLVPHGLFSLESSTSLNYEPSLDGLPLLDSTLLYACCPWLSTLQQAILKQPVSDSTSILSTPTKISLVTAGNRTLLQLRENFFHHQPHTVRKVCEFLCERIHSNALSDTQTRLVPLIRHELSGEIKTWIDSQDTKELLERSLNSRLQFFLGALVCKFCEDIKVKCSDQIAEFCQASCDRLMRDLLPAKTENSVVAVATRLTVEKAGAKCAIWWNNMALSFVEREVQQIADIHIKHVLSEVESTRVEEGELRLLLGSLPHILLRVDSGENCNDEESEESSLARGKFERLIELINTTVINKENTSLFQSVADATVDVMVEYIANSAKIIRWNQYPNKPTSIDKSLKLTSPTQQTESVNQAEIDKEGLRTIFDPESIDPLSFLLLQLRDKKGVEIKLTKLPLSVSSQVLSGVNCEKPSRFSGERFIENCMKLVYIGVLSPPRLEHWFLWFLETCHGDEIPGVVSFANRTINEYFTLKANVLTGRLPYVPRVAYFLKQYIVSDFEILKNKLNSI